MVTLLIEAWFREELRKYAVELRKLAYSLPNGVGERGLLQLSERMNSAADQDLGAASSGADDEPLRLDTQIDSTSLAESDSEDEPLRHHGRSAASIAGWPDEVMLLASDA